MHAELIVLGSSAGVPTAHRFPTALALKVNELLSGDIRSSGDLAPHVADCSLVSHEFGHMPLESIRDFAIAHRIKRLLVTHIHHEWDERTAEMRRILAEGYEGEIFVGADGLRIPLAP